MYLRQGLHCFLKFIYEENIKSGKGIMFNLWVNAVENVVLLAS